MDQGTIALLLAGAGVGLWVLSNLHFWIRTGRAVETIKTDINTKRAATEEFVKKELADLKTAMPSMPAGLAERTEETLGTVRSLGTYVQDQMKHFAAEFKRLPTVIDMHIKAIRSAEAREMYKLGDEATEMVEGEAALAIEQDPNLADVRREMRFMELSKKYAEKNPAGAYILEELRDLFQLRRSQNAGGRSYISASRRSGGGKDV